MRAFRAPVAFDGWGFLDGGATVLTDETRIVGVEPFGFEAPADTEVTTYDGTLLPGLFDAHVHLVSDGSPGALERAGTLPDGALDDVISASLAAQAAGGVTTVRDLGDSRFRTLVARDRAAPGVPRIIAAGPPLTTPAGHCHYLGGEVGDRESIRARIVGHAARGVDVIKVMATGGMLTPGTDVLGVQFDDAELAGLVVAGHEAGLKVLAHAHSLTGAWAAVHAGVDGIEHLTCLTDSGPDVTDELLDAIAEAGVVVDPTYGFDPERFAAIGTPPPQMVALLERLNVTPEMVFRRRAEGAGRFLEHGVTVVSGLDAGAAPVKLHGGIWRAVTALQTGGYPAAEALRTATSEAAAACGLAEVTGRLAPGLDADLLVVDGDLRSEPDALGRPVVVLLRGRSPASAPAG